MSKCRDAFSKEAPGRAKALLSQKYLAILFYTDIPPQRAKEYQSLCYKVCKKNKLPAPGDTDKDAPNCLYLSRDGSQGFIKITEYKTKKSHGDDYIPLEEAPLLKEHLIVHLSVHRPNLDPVEGVKHLFVVRQ